MTEITRLKRRKDFVRLTRCGKSLVTPGFILQICKNPDSETSVRVGFTASKKIGGAVERNRAKRRLRELARLFMSKYSVCGFDYVLVARRFSLFRDFEKMQQDLTKVMEDADTQ